METPHHPESTSPKGDFTREQARERQYQSKVKSLLYGGDERPATPVHEGKKSVPHAMGAVSPFATHEAVAEAQATGCKAHVAKLKRNQQPLKIGEVGFDPSIYRNNLAANAVNIAALKQKAWGSGQVMPARDKDAQDAPYEVGTIIQTPKNSLLPRNFPPDE